MRANGGIGCTRSIIQDAREKRPSEQQESVDRMALLSREYHKNPYKTPLDASVLPANSLDER
jgi:hypothetical protein